MLLKDYSSLKGYTDLFYIKSEGWIRVHPSLYTLMCFILVRITRYLISVTPETTSVRGDIDKDAQDQDGPIEVCNAAWVNKKVHQYGPGDERPGQQVQQQVLIEGIVDINGVDQPPHSLRKTWGSPTTNSRMLHNS